MLRNGDILGVCLKIGLNFPMQMFTRRKRSRRWAAKENRRKNVGRSRISVQRSHKFQGRAIVKHESCGNEMEKRIITTSCSWAFRIDMSPSTLHMNWMGTWWMWPSKRSKWCYKHSHGLIGKPWREERFGARAQGKPLTRTQDILNARNRSSRRKYWLTQCEWKPIRGSYLILRIDAGWVRRLPEDKERGLIPEPHNEPAGGVGLRGEVGAYVGGALLVLVHGEELNFIPNDISGDRWW